MDHLCSNWCHSLTGLSKAARVGHLKAIMSMAFFQMCGATSDDIIYITLPLYHMSASLLGIGGCIHLGKNSCTVVNVEFKLRLWSTLPRGTRFTPIVHHTESRSTSTDCHAIVIDNWYVIHIFLRIS